MDAPDAVFTLVTSGINNGAAWSERYWNSEDVPHGFLLRHGHFTSTSTCPARLKPHPLGIDDLGRIVGFYRGSDEIFRGFMLDALSYRDIEFPDAAATGASGINTRTWIVGGYIDTNEVTTGSS